MAKRAQMAEQTATASASQATAVLEPQEEIRPQAGPQERALACSADILIYGGAAGGGKALDVDTWIPTPTGWTRLGLIQAGDQVLTETGQSCTVLAAHPPYEADFTYRLRFDDGTEVLADPSHLWQTFTAKDLAALSRRTDVYRESRRANRQSKRGTKKSDKFAAMITARNQARGADQCQTPPSGSIRCTQEIVDTLRTASGRSNHAIPVCQPVIGLEAHLPVDPYLLGVWLGDGTTRDGAITTADQEIVEAFKSAGYVVTKWKYKYSYGVHGLSADLRKAGVFNDKHIPAAYLRASIEQRTALLQGLMDTDGTATKDGKAQFTSTSYRLAYGVAELARSLGSKVAIVTKQAKLRGKYCGPCWSVAWAPSYSVFRLSRKAKRQKLVRRRTTQFRYIVEAEIQPSCMVRCLTVDNPTRLYLCTESFVPTHNTWALLLETIRHYENKDFGAVVFRRTYPNITNEGGMWDESKKLFPLLGGKPDNGDLHWAFPKGSRIKFSHLQHDDDRLSWKGAQIPLICFDQLEEFLESQFWYMVSRNRSMCGVAPYVRATVNPVPEDDKVGGWVHKLISWWLDEDTGLARPERDGVIRWFLRPQNDLVWFDTREEAVAAAIALGHAPDKAHIMPKSLTFISARLEDNYKLMAADPGYYANLMALPLVERERLHGGNWKIRPSAGLVFNRAWFEIVEALPADCRYIRYWDKAGTQDGGMYSAGVKIGYSPSLKLWFVAHVVRGQWSAAAREAVIKQTAMVDGAEIPVWVEQEPGSGGKESAQNTILNLAGLICRADKVTGDKYTRALPMAAQAEVGNVKVLVGEWNQAYLDELHAFDPDADGYKDQVDASSGAFNKLTLGYGGLQLFSGGKPLGAKSAEAQALAEKLPSGRTAFEEQVQRNHFYWPSGR